MLAVAATGLPMALVCVATLGAGLDPERLLRDPAPFTGEPFYLGAFSHFGVLAWWSAAMAGLLGGLALPPGRSRRALLLGGAISALLAMDDLLLLHEEVLPVLLGLPERAVLAIHATLVAAYLWHYRAWHRARGAGALVAGLGLAAASVVVDLTEGGSMLLEDTLKFGGICGWAAYHLRAAAQVLRTAR